MVVGPPEAAYRSSLQTTLWCFAGNGEVLSDKEKVSWRDQVRVRETNASEPIDDVSRKLTCCQNRIIVRDTREEFSDDLFIG
jgi:hypothetical protein